MSNPMDLFSNPHPQNESHKNFHMYMNNDNKKKKKKDERKNMRGFLPKSQFEMNNKHTVHRYVHENNNINDINDDGNSEFKEPFPVNKCRANKPKIYKNHNNEEHINKFDLYNKNNNKDEKTNFYERKKKFKVGSDINKYKKNYNNKKVHKHTNNITTISYENMDDVSNIYMENNSDNENISDEKEIEVLDSDENNDSENNDNFDNNDIYNKTNKNDKENKQIDIKKKKINLPVLKIRSCEDTKIKANQENNVDNIPTNNSSKDSSALTILKTKCSRSELINREKQNQLSVLELDPELTHFDNKTGMWVRKGKFELAVQAYARPRGEKGALKEIKSIPALKETVEYLVKEVADADRVVNNKFVNLPGIKVNLLEVVTFMLDRFRAVRKNFTVIEGSEFCKVCIEAHEKMVRFMIIMLNDTLDIKEICGSQGLYCQFKEQLYNTLKSLIGFYKSCEIKKIKIEEEMKKDGNIQNIENNIFNIDNNEENKDKIKNNGIINNTNKQNSEIICASDLIPLIPTSPQKFTSLTLNAPYFYSYYTLLSFEQDPIEFVSILSEVPIKILKSPQFQLILDICNSLSNHSYIKFMDIIKSEKCDYITACLCAIFFRNVRIWAFHEWMGNQAETELKMKQILEILPFENYKEIYQFMKWIGVDVTNIIDNIDKDDNVVDSNNELNLDNIENISEKIVKITNNRISDGNLKLIDSPLYTNKRYVDCKRKGKLRRFYINDGKEEIDNIQNNKEQIEIITNKTDNNNNGKINDIINFSFGDNNDYKQENIPEKSNQISNEIIINDDKKKIEIKNNIESNKTEQNTSNTNLVINTKKYNKFSSENLNYFLKTSQIYINKILFELKFEFIYILKFLKIIYNLKKDKIIKYLKYKKLKIFNEFRKKCINLRYKKLIKNKILNYNNNLNIYNTLENTCFTSENSYNFNMKKMLYTYNKVLYYYLLKKIDINQYNNDNEYDLQYMCFTTKNMLESTKMLLLLRLETSKINIKSCEILFSDKNEIKLNDNLKLKYHIGITFILIDEIYNLSEYIEENIQKLIYFDIGIIMFDIKNIEKYYDIITNFKTILDMSLSDNIKKKFKFIFPYPDEISKEYDRKNNILDQKIYDNFMNEINTKYGINKIYSDNNNDNNINNDGNNNNKINNNDYFFIYNINTSSEMNISENKFYNNKKLYENLFINIPKNELFVNTSMFKKLYNINKKIYISSENNLKRLITIIAKSMENYINNQYSLKYQFVIGIFSFIIFINFLNELCNNTLNILLKFNKNSIPNNIGKIISNLLTYSRLFKDFNNKVLNKTIEAIKIIRKNSDDLDKTISDMNENIDYNNKNISQSYNNSRENTIFFFGFLIDNIKKIKVFDINLLNKLSQKFKKNYYEISFSNKKYNVANFIVDFGIDLFINFMDEFPFYVYLNNDIELEKDENNKYLNNDNTNYNDNYYDNNIINNDDNENIIDINNKEKYNFTDLFYRIYLSKKEEINNVLKDFYSDNYNNKEFNLYGNDFKNNNNYYIENENKYTQFLGKKRKIGLFFPELLEIN